MNLFFESGGFWDGDRRTASLNGTYRVNRNLDLSSRYAANWVDLPQASFNTHLISGRVQIAVRKDVVLMSLLQYNSATRQLSSNIRFNWIPKPGTDLFVVYNELDERMPGLTLRNRSLAIKLNYLFSF